MACESWAGEIGPGGGRQANGTDDYRSDVTEVRSAPPEDDVLDGIDALQVLRADTPEAKSKLLEQIAGSGKVEQDIVSELSKVRPLWRPAAFESAHRMAMRSLEVLDRNGARAARMPPIGPLKPLASFLVQLVTRWIVEEPPERPRHRDPQAL